MNGARPDASPALRFRRDGTFTIVQLTDLHWRNGGSKDRRTRDLVNRVLEQEQPDLTIFTGDLIHSLKCRDPLRALGDALSAAAASGIPWAAVFGNHDAEGRVTRRELMREMCGLPGCLAQAGPDSVYGLGNYSIRLAGPDGDPCAVLYLLDSGVLPDGDEGIHPSQIGWLVREAEALARQQAGRPVPALAFFHIPLPEYERMWRTQICDGNKRERISCPAVNVGAWRAMSEQAGVVGAFCGHDHRNDFGGRLQQMRMYYGRVSGYHAYARWLYPRGARVIRLHADVDLREFDTWIRLHDGRKIDRPRLHRPRG